MRVLKTKKTVSAGMFRAVPLGEADSVMPPPVTTKEYNRKICPPDRHNWHNRKHTKICTKCGKEETR